MEQEIESRAGKIDLGEIIRNLINEIEEVDASGDTTTIKSRRSKGAANKVITSLFGKRSKIAPTTGVRYMSTIRGAVTEKGLFHHSFQKSMERIKRNNKLFENEIESLSDLDLVSFRMAVDQLKIKFHAVDSISKEIDSISPKQSNYVTRLTDLANRHPAWAAEIKHLKQRSIEKRTLTINELKNKLSATDNFLQSLNSLKIDHEVMRWLKVPTEKKQRVESAQEAALMRKKDGGVITIDYKVLMQTIEYLLNPKVINDTWTWEALATAVAFATGRRPIEVLLQGRFKKIDNQRLLFSGQAKERGGVDYSNEIEIYSLVNSDFVIEAVEKLRHFSLVKNLNELPKERHHEQNKLVNNRVAGPLNLFIRQLMLGAGITTGIKGRHWIFKDTRAIYGKLCFDLFFDTDPRWEKIDQDMFFLQLLGHSEMNAQQHYKHIKFRNLGKKWETLQPETKDRLTELENFDGHPGLSTRGMSAIHEWVKDYVAKNPTLEVLPNTIRKGKGSRADAAKRYVEITGNALALNINLADILAAEEPEEDTTQDNIQEKAPKKKVKEKVKEEARPHFKLPHNNGDGTFKCDFTIGEKNVSYTVEANGTREAMQAAWDKYQSEK